MIKGSIINMKEKSILTEINGANLAYVGDAVIELLVRKKLVTQGGKLGELNRKADAFVRAGYQCKALERLIPIMTEEEAAVFRRGKNIHTNSIPKNATQAEYRKATGLEAVFGYLYLKDEQERIEFLLETGFFQDDKSE